MHRTTCVQVVRFGQHGQQYGHCRGCLGRPWLFRELADVFAGRPPTPGPTFGEVADIMTEHARLLVEWFGAEKPSMLAFRKHAGWYTKGFASSAALRDRLMRVKTLAELDEVLVTVDRDEPYPENAHLFRRGKRQGTQKVALPPGFLDTLDDDTPPEDDGSEAISAG